MMIMLYSYCQTNNCHNFIDIIIFRRIWNIQEKLFIQYSVQWGQIYFFNFFSVQNCQLFLFKNKWQQ